MLEVVFEAVSAGSLSLDLSDIKKNNSITHAKHYGPNSQRILGFS